MPRPPLSSVVREFWARIGAGCTAAEASMAVGVSCATGVRWFADAGGVNPQRREPTISGPWPRLTLADFDRRFGSRLTTKFGVGAAGAGASLTTNLRVSELVSSGAGWTEPCDGLAIRIGGAVGSLSITGACFGVSDGDVRCWESTVLAELARRGFATVDTDEGSWIESLRVRRCCPAALLHEASRILADRLTFSSVHNRDMRYRRDRWGQCDSLRGRTERAGSCAS